MVFYLFEAKRHKQMFQMFHRKQLLAPTNIITISINKKKQCGPLSALCLPVHLPDPLIVISLLLWHNLNNTF